MTMILGIETPSHEWAVVKLRDKYPSVDVIVCSYSYLDARPIAAARMWVPGGLETVESIDCDVSA